MCITRRFSVNYFDLCADTTDVRQRNAFDVLLCFILADVWSALFLLSARALFAVQHTQIMESDDLPNVAFARGQLGEAQTRLAEQDHELKVARTARYEGDSRLASARREGRGVIEAEADLAFLRDVEKTAMQLVASSQEKGVLFSRHLAAAMEIELVRVKTQHASSGSKRPRSSTGLSALFHPSTALEVSSPTAAGEGLLDHPFSHIVLEAPMTVDTQLTGEEYNLYGRNVDHAMYGREAIHYADAVEFLPEGTEVCGRAGGGGSVTAAGLYKERRRQDPPFVSLPWNCKPELPVRALRGWPGFNGELKSLPAAAWREVLTYVCFSILDSLFPPTPGAEIYHFEPPTGYGLLSVAGNGFFAAVEWVGRLFVSPITHPFTLKSQEHRRAVEGLTVRRVDEWIVLDMEADCTWDIYPDAVAVDVHEFFWSKSPINLRRVSAEGVCKETLHNRFVKIITLKAFKHMTVANSCRRFRDLHRVYNKYNKLYAEAAAGSHADGRPAALVSAQLLYGAFSLMVSMPFVEGRRPTVAELEQPGLVVEQLACAIVWLARRGLLYCDVRAANVLVTEAQGRLAARLLDYDDAVLVEPGSVRCLADMLSKLAAHSALHGERDCSENLRSLDVLCGRVDQLLSPHYD